MASHDQQQRQSYRADDEAKGQAQVPYPHPPTNIRVGLAFWSRLVHGKGGLRSHVGKSRYVKSLPCTLKNRKESEALLHPLESIGQEMGSVEDKAQEVGNSIYDAIQEAKEVVKQKASEAAQKPQDAAHYGKDKTGMHGQGG
ncbi:unnamed protein product [Prunus armeniaca]|uniref:Uncharacterized protein n=1 Tax=Prunus armeniaca TaxID=36596 RepID=A0A6J5WUA5_PRUAR|nr:unnamed protein product [Prunus armeniaca]